MTFRNRLWLYRYVLVGLLLVFLFPRVVFWYPPASSLPFGIQLFGMTAGMVLLAALSFWLQLRELRLLMERLRQAKGRLCLRCQYNLDGLGDTGRCPECSEPFNIAETLKHWRKLRGWEDS